MIRPRPLRAGGRVALVAPAGPLQPGAIERAVERVRQLGWEPVVGAHAGSRLGYLAGSDRDRLDDLAWAFAGDNEAIWCLRGGYGNMRIIASIDFTPLRERPRPLIGFSDNTVLHLAALRTGIMTFHGPHAGVSEFPPFTRDCLRRALTGMPPLGVLSAPPDLPPPTPIVPGVAEGRLVGGNLSLIAATVGTPYQVEADGAILFLEEVGEPAYRLDRLLTQLLLAGILGRVSGVAVGAISERPDGGAELPSTAEILRDRLGHLGVPVTYGLPFGHIPESWTLPLGVAARLDATRGSLEILDTVLSE